jgi:3-oxoacyl-[acyl-carrier protein] reductase
LVKADVGQIEQAQTMVSTAQEELGPIDVLINNAGVFPRVPFLEMTERDWDHVLDVNLKGSCFCAQAVAKAMVAAGRKGSIINIASGAALRGSPRGENDNRRPARSCARRGGCAPTSSRCRPITVSTPIITSAS